MPNYLKIADEAGDAVRRTIRAYHGSPRPVHFDRFDSSKIGTGEGAQAYGHGMYFAGNKDVADDYRRSLSAKEFQQRFDQAGLPYYADFDEVMDAMEAFDPRQQELLRRLREEDFLGFDYPSQAISESLRRGMPTRYEVGPELIHARDQVGTGSEVELGVPESSLVDWEGPFLKQSPVVRSAMGEFVKHQDLDEVNGARALLTMGVKFGGGWGNFYTPQLSEALLGRGVPGIRYLDRNSRRVGSGTRNYVMFPGTEDKIRILRKYAVPPLIAAGMQGEEE